MGGHTEVLLGIWEAMQRKKEKQVEQTMTTEARDAWLKEMEKDLEGKMELMTGGQALEKSAVSEIREAAFVLASPPPLGERWFSIRSGALVSSFNRGEDWHSYKTIANLLMPNLRFRKVRPEEWFDYREPEEEQHLPDDLSESRILNDFISAGFEKTHHEIAKRILQEVDRRIAASKEETK